MKSIMKTRDENSESSFCLEEENSFFLCDPMRNFIAGRPIITNITKAIYASRRVILFISRYVLSYHDYDGLFLLVQWTCCKRVDHVDKDMIATRHAL